MCRPYYFRPAFQIFVILHVVLRKVFGCKKDEVIEEFGHEELPNFYWLPSIVWVTNLGGLNGWSCD